MPARIRTDNGAPFAGTGLLGLSKLSLGWMKLGIVHERIQAGRPQQNGRHERMHRTLKEDTTKPPAASLRAQQSRFDNFRYVFNNERPHEGLNNQVPASLYIPSAIRLPRKLPEFTYPKGLQCDESTIVATLAGTRTESSSARYSASKSWESS